MSLLLASLTGCAKLAVLCHKKMANEPIKVLHVVSSLDPRSGGPVEALRGLALAQHSVGLHVSVVATWKRGDDLQLAELLRAAGIGVRLVGPCWGSSRLSFPLSHVAREEVRGAFLVHIHALWEEIQHQAARSARVLGRPYIMRTCGMLDPWSLRQGRWKKSLYLWWRLRGHLQNASALHFTTKLEQELTTPLKLTAPAIIEPNGIDGAEYENLPPRGPFRERHGIPKSARVALFLGRLHPKKGLEILLPAFAKAALDHDYYLIVAGPHEVHYRAKLESTVEALGLKARVLFIGQVLGAEKIAAFANADLFVLPSHQESFGIAVIEALAAGLPVLISDQVNLHTEISQAKVGGVLPLDVDVWARELGRWLGDESLGRETGLRGRAFVLSRFLWPQIAQRWSEHYRQLVGQQEKC